MSFFINTKACLKTSRGFPYSLLSEAFLSNYISHAGMIYFPDTAFFLRMLSRRASASVSLSVRMLI